MKISTMLASAPALACTLLFAALPARAQDTASSSTLNTATTGTPPAPATSDAVRDALAKKDTDADNTTLLKETLTAVDKQYSLIRKGKVQLNYELGYSYIGQEKINTDLSSGTATLFSIENTNSHTITNTILADYGVLNNLTANVTVPLISRYSDGAGFSGVSHTIGDLGLGVRWQPQEVKRDEIAYTITGGMRLATGTSPY
jgi:hypothetical protein